MNLLEGECARCLFFNSNQHEVHLKLDLETKLKLVGRSIEIYRENDQNGL